MTTALVAGAAAVLGSLLTIFLTPWLQHHLWRYQRRAEIRLATAKEFNRLTTEFLAAKLLPTPASPGAASKWFTELNIVGSDVAVLFSPKALAAVIRLDNMVDTYAPEFDRNAFIAAREAALRVLYAEVIPLGS